MAAALAIGFSGLLVRAQEPAPPGDRAAGTTLAARLRTQQWATRKAKAAYDIAKARRELAEIAVSEYVEVGFLQELAAVEADLRRAQAALKKIKTELEQELDRFGRNPLAGNPVYSQLALKKAEFRVEQAESRRKVLVQYTKWKTLKGLQGTVERARSDELAKKAASEREKANEANLDRPTVGPRKELVFNRI
jgi:hypothetical protein